MIFPGIAPVLARILMFVHGVIRCFYSFSFNWTSYAIIRRLGYPLGIVSWKRPAATRSTPRMSSPKLGRKYHGATPAVVRSASRHARTAVQWRTMVGTDRELLQKTAVPPLLFLGYFMGNGLRPVIMTSWSGGSSGQPPLYHNNIMYAMTFCFQRIGKFYHVNMKIQVFFMINFINFQKNSSIILSHLYQMGYEFTKISDDVMIFE